METLQFPGQKSFEQGRLAGAPGWRSSRRVVRAEGCADPLGMLSRGLFLAVASFLWTEASLAMSQAASERLEESAKDLERVPPLCPIEVRAPTPWEEVEDTSSDWIQLKTGEWFRGEIVRMRDDSLVFVSAGVGERSFFWGSVSQLHSPRRLIYAFDDRSMVMGSADVKEDKLWITTSQGLVGFPQDEVLSIIPQRDSEISKWTFRANVGVNSRSGNTDSFDFSSFARLVRSDIFSRASLEYNGAYGTVSGVDNTNKQRGDASWDLFISPLVFLTPVSGEALYDKFQNIALRWSVASGAGAHVLQSAPLKIDAKLATGYLMYIYASSLSGQENSAQGAFARPGIDLRWNISGNLSWEFQWQSTIVVTDLSRTFHHGVSRLSIALTRALRVDLSAIYDRQETPVEDANGRLPGRDDLAVNVGIGVEFK